MRRPRNSAAVKESSLIAFFTENPSNAGIPWLGTKDFKYLPRGVQTDRYIGQNGDLAVNALLFLRTCSLY